MKNYYIVNAEDLLHFGTKKHSGRYPYGSGDRPYQREKKVGYFQQRKQKKAQAVQAKKRLESLQKAREAAAAKRQHDADKARVLREGTASEVLKYKGELTNQELQNVVTRINLESQLSHYSSKDIQRNMDKIDKIMKDVQTMTNWAKIGTETYNTIAKIYNTTDAGKENPWPLVTGGGDQQKKK